MKSDVRDEVNRAADAADVRRQPDTSTLVANIFADTPEFEENDPRPISTEPVTMIDAINHALREEMQRNPKILMWEKMLLIGKAEFSASHADSASAFLAAFSIPRWRKRASPASREAWRSQAINRLSKCSLAIICGPPRCNSAMRFQRCAGAATEHGTAPSWCGLPSEVTLRAAPGTRLASKVSSHIFRVGESHPKLRRRC